jgi:hypothetical protein
MDAGDARGGAPAAFFIQNNESSFRYRGRRNTSLVHALHKSSLRPVGVAGCQANPTTHICRLFYVPDAKASRNVQVPPIAGSPRGLISLILFHFSRQRRAGSPTAIRHFRFNFSSRTSAAPFQLPKPPIQASSRGVRSPWTFPSGNVLVARFLFIPHCAAITLSKVTSERETYTSPPRL